MIIFRWLRILFHRHQWVIRRWVPRCAEDGPYVERECTICHKVEEVDEVDA